MAKGEVFMIGDAPVSIDEFRRRWTENLRSGNYNQTRYRLKDQCGFCCLGVAAETLREMNVPASWESEDSHNGSLLSIEGRLCKSALPCRFNVLIGIFQCKCMRWNDGGSASFSEIADYLEHHWEEAEASNVVGE